MKVVVHNRNDGGVTISHFSRTLLAVMTGTGTGWNQERIDHEVGKFVASGKAVDVILPYITALANGGITEMRAIELINAKDDTANCLGCTIIEDTDLPTDRYFRAAWEWEN